MHHDARDLWKTSHPVSPEVAGLQDCIRMLQHQNRQYKAEIEQKDDVIWGTERVIGSWREALQQVLNECGDDAVSLTATMSVHGSPEVSAILPAGETDAGGYGTQQRP